MIGTCRGEHDSEAAEFSLIEGVVAAQSLPAEAIVFGLLSLVGVVGGLPSLFWGSSLSLIRAQPLKELPFLLYKV